jgi:hypothetical protein
MVGFVQDLDSRVKEFVEILSASSLRNATMGISFRATDAIQVVGSKHIGSAIPMFTVWLTLPLFAILFVAMVISHSLKNATMETTSLAMAAPQIAAQRLVSYAANHMRSLHWVKAYAKFTKLS